jgi:hypothetical protein
VKQCNARFILVREKQGPEQERGEAGTFEWLMRTKLFPNLAATQRSDFSVDSSVAFTRLKHLSCLPTLTMKTKLLSLEFTAFQGSPVQKVFPQ